MENGDASFHGCAYTVFLDNLRHIMVTAERNGVPVRFLISCAVIEHLATARRLSKGESFTVVVQNKVHLEEAANRASHRHGSGGTVTVEMVDIALDGSTVV